MVTQSQPPNYLIADLHLDAERPETTHLFADFLDGPAREAGSLYIMGDLFEAWIGDDAQDSLAQTVAVHLRALAETGVSIFFICGNRDFLLGEDYCRQAGMSYLEEPYMLPESEPPVLLLHGDILCTDDVSYQRFRRKVRNPGWQRRILSRPVWWRRMLARLARIMSRRHTGSTKAEIMDVNDQAVDDFFRSHGIRRIVHGHTHRPAIHDLEIDNQHCQRIVLGDWGEQGNLVRVDDDGIAMLNIARGDNGDIELRLQETAAPLVRS